MANYLPIYILISLIPLIFLAIACCSSSAKVQRLSECRLLSCLTRRNRNNNATDAPKTTTTDDIELQCIRVDGPYPPSNRDLHRTASLMRTRSDNPFSQTSLDHRLPRAPPTRQSRTPGPTTSQHHRAAALALLERPRSGSSSSSSSSMFNNMPDHLPPRPSAPSPPSSTASAGWFYAYRSRQWWGDEDEVALAEGGGSSRDEDVVMQAFRRESALPGRKSVLRLDHQGDGWTDVSLR